MLIYFPKLTNVECVYKFDTEDTLCDINYIFGDQGIEGTYILQFHKTLLELDFSRGDGKIRISFSDLYFGPLLRTRRRLIA